MSSIYDTCPISQTTRPTTPFRAPDHQLSRRAELGCACTLTAANVNDSLVFEQVLEAIPPIRRRRGAPGRPRRRPAKLHADKGYDKRHCRRYCTRHHIACRIARIGIESSARLGRHRWIVERTGAWFNRFRRLRIRDERRADIHAAFIALAAALILFGYLRRYYRSARAAI